MRLAGLMGALWAALCGPVLAQGLLLGVGGGGGGGSSLYAAWSNFPQAQSFIPISVYYLNPTGTINTTTYNGTGSPYSGQNEMAVSVALGINILELIAPVGGSPYPANTTTDNGEAAAIKAAGIYVVAGEGMLSDGSVANSTGTLQSTAASHRGSVADIQSVFANAGASAYLIGFNAGDEPVDANNYGYQGLCDTTTTSNLSTMKGYDTTRLTMYNVARWFNGFQCSAPQSPTVFQQTPSVSSFDDYATINTNDYLSEPLYVRYNPSDFISVPADSMFLESVDIQGALANNAAGQPQWVFLSGGDNAQGTSGLANCLVKTDNNANTGAVILTSGSTKAVNNTGKSKFTSSWVGMGLLDRHYNIANTAVSGTGTTATIGFYGYNGCGQIFTVGSQITVAGFNPTGYNGTYTVTASSAGSVSYANTTTGAGSNLALTATTTSSNISVIGGGNNVRVFNNGATKVYINLGVGSGTVATTSNTAVAAGGVMDFTEGANTYLAAITASGSDSLTLQLTGAVFSTALPAGTTISSIIGSVANGVDGCTQAAGCTEATMSAAAASSDTTNLAFVVGGEPQYLDAPWDHPGSDCILSFNLCLAMGNEYRPTPSEVNASAWLAFINNANGIEWFCHDTMGDSFCLSNISSYNTEATGYNLSATQSQNEQLAANAAAANLKTVDAGLALYGSVLNDTSTVVCNMDGFTYSTQAYSLNNNTCFGGGTLMSKHTGSTIPGAAILKTHAGIKYLIAQSTRRGSGSYDFTVPGGASQTATVVYDSDCQYDPTHAASTVTTFTGCAAGSGTGTFVLNGSGQFTDALGANGDNYQTKIYRVQ